MTIREILDALARARDGRPLQPAASEAAIAALDAELRGSHDRALPAALREVYAIADGIDHDGFQVFATKRAPFAAAPRRSINALVEMNGAYGDFKGLGGRLIFANDNGPDVWGIADDGTVKVVDDMGGEVETYPSLAAALEARLRRYFA